MPGVYTKKRKTAFFVGLALIAAGIVVVGLTQRDSLLPEPITPIVEAPTLDQLNKAIDRAQVYLDGMYRDIGDGSAVQSEYYALPLRVFFSETNTWSLLGQDNTTSIEAGSSDQLKEEYTISFGSGAFVAQVVREWKEDTGEYRLTITPKTVRSLADIWLGTIPLGSITADDPKPLVTSFLKDYADLASLRYTVRHATQQALMYWQIRGNDDRVDKLSHFLAVNHYQQGVDFRAIMFDRARGLPDNLPFNRDAYPDCLQLPKANFLAYPYASKACAVLGAYFPAAMNDPFMQAEHALHNLQKYGDPDKKYQLSKIETDLLQATTPRETVKQLQRQWSRTNNSGVPACTPTGCQSVASGIRTYAFGLLATELGYRFGGDDKTRRFADLAVVQTINTQITTGYIKMHDGSRLLRPVYNGGFLAYWDDDNQFAPPDPSFIGPLVLTLLDEPAMPPEYQGVIPSNSETGFDAWAFLTRYRCDVYNVGCYEPN